ncbi:MAG: hypothetical protein EBY49_01535 [Actinobacteria bacterium]|nr:hypothetical protein [Actinomycetota bacterium]
MLLGWKLSRALARSNRLIELTEQVETLRRYLSQRQLDLQSNLDMWEERREKAIENADLERMRLATVARNGYYLEKRTVDKIAEIISE